MVKQAQQAAVMQQAELQLQLGRAEGESSGLRSRISHLESELNSYLSIFIYLFIKNIHFDTCVLIRTTTETPCQWWMG